MRSLLDHQADGIEYTLHSHGIEASVVGGNISPRLIQFSYQTGYGVKFNRVAALSEEMALALGVTHCRITRDGYFVKVEVPRPDPQAVKLFPLMRNLPGTIPLNSPILGLDETGGAFAMRLNSPDVAHILISGTTGSGKTILARSMIASLALQNSPDQLRLLLIDPKGRGYRDFNGLPHLVCPVVTDLAGRAAPVEMGGPSHGKAGRKRHQQPFTGYFIDELADLIMVGGKEMELQVARLTQRGREAGIHIVLRTQKPSANVIGGIAKSNFPTRLVGRVVSPEDARVASGVAGSGAEKLLGRGDFLLFASGEATRVQGAHITQEEMLQTVEHLIQQYPEEVRQAAGQVSQTMTYRHQQTTPQPEARPTKAVSRRNSPPIYSADFDDEFGNEDLIGPNSPASPAPITGLARLLAGPGPAILKKIWRTSRGLPTGLEAYYQTIQQRRQKQGAVPPASSTKNNSAKRGSLYRPAPARNAPERKAPSKVYEQDLWSRENEDLPGNAGDDYDFEDFEDFDDTPPAPTRLKPAAVRRKPGS